MRPLFILAICFLILSGCVSSGGGEEYKRAGSIVEHKLSKKKCIIKNIGRDEEGWGAVNTDYNQAECRFEDGALEWIDLDEYELTQPKEEDEHES